MDNANEMKLISCEELKDKLDRKDNFKLVMTYHEWAFNAKHIPGSINIYSEESVRGLIEPSDEVVVYCVSERCNASIKAYRILTENGFNNVRRFAGGLVEWDAMGFPLAGNEAEKVIEVDNNFSL